MRRLLTIFMCAVLTAGGSHQCTRNDYIKRAQIKDGPSIIELHATKTAEEARAYLERYYTARAAYAQGQETDFERMYPWRIVQDWMPSDIALWDKERDRLMALCWKWEKLARSVKK